MRSILRWAGSKKRLLPLLLKTVPNRYSRYFEPFCGSSCLFAKLEPKLAVLGDMNRELMLFYKYIRWRPRAVHSLVLQMPDTSDYYYHLRSQDPERLDPIARAARFYYLNRYCFNGVYRTNKNGNFNVPRGNYQGSIPSLNETLSFANLLKNAELRAEDFEKSLFDAKKDDYIYLDPPYALGNKIDRGEYGVGAFREIDLPRLIATLEHLDNSGATVVLSYSSTPSLIEKLHGWSVVEINVARTVAGFSAAREVVTEIIASNRPLKSLE